MPNSGHRGDPGRSCRYDFRHLFLRTVRTLEWAERDHRHGEAASSHRLWSLGTLGSPDVSDASGQRHPVLDELHQPADVEGRALGKIRDIVPKRYSTSTLIDSATCVPWLAAEGPLAYTPENPPATDYFFQYSWILPEVFNAKVHKRRHHYFGTPIRDHAKPLFEFWRQARRRELDRVYFH